MDERVGNQTAIDTGCHRGSQSTLCMNGSVKKPSQWWSAVVARPVFQNAIKEMTDTQAAVTQLPNNDTTIVEVPNTKKGAARRLPQDFAILIMCRVAQRPSGTCHCPRTIHSHRRNVS